MTIETISHLSEVLFYFGVHFFSTNILPLRGKWLICAVEESQINAEDAEIAEYFFAFNIYLIMINFVFFAVSVLNLGIYGRNIF
jgi:hypothetical protein